MLRRGGRGGKFRDEGRDKAGKGGEDGDQSHATPPSPPLPGRLRVKIATTASVDSPQDRADLGVVQHVIPKPVVVLRASLSKLALVKRQMPIGVQAGGNPQRVSRKIALVAVLATNGKHGVGLWRHVEAPVAQGIEVPVAAAVVL